MLFVSLIITFFTLDFCYPTRPSQVSTDGFPCPPQSTLKKMFPTRIPEGFPFPVKTKNGNGRKIVAEMTTKQGTREARGRAVMAFTTELFTMEKMKK